MRLAAIIPTPAVETLLYAPPATQRAMVKVFVNNRNGSAATITLFHRPAGGPSVPVDRLADELIPAGANRRSEYFEVENPEEVTVISDLANVVFQVNGSERPS